MIKIANVGTLRNKDDEYRLFQVVEYLCHFHLQFLDDDTEHDDINLKEPICRDFLKENKKYDLIILYFLYRYPDRIPGHIKNDLHCGSDIHSPEIWNKKLNESNSKFIFCFGERSEVNCDYFGELANYDRRFIMHKQRGFCFDVFKLKTFGVL